MEYLFVFIIAIIIISVVSIVKNFFRKKECKKRFNEVSEKYQKALDHFNQNIVTKTQEYLEILGKAKINSLKNISHLVEKAATKFNLDQIMTKPYLRQNDEKLRQIFIEEPQKLENISLKISDLGLATTSSGLVKIGATGLVSTLGTASTGTAINTLYGVANHNATLAWLGGGSKAVGGAGMAGGSIVLGGLSLSALISYLSYQDYKKTKLFSARVKKYEEEVESRIIAIEKATNELNEMNKFSDEIKETLEFLSKKLGFALKAIRFLPNNFKIVYFTIFIIILLPIHYYFVNEFTLSGFYYVPYVLLVIIFTYYFARKRKEIILPKWLILKIKQIEMLLNSFYDLIDLEIMTEDGVLNNNSVQKLEKIKNNIGLR